MALHARAPVAVADVDVLLSVADARSILARLRVSHVTDSGDGLFLSEVFGRWLDAPLAVEFMADLHVRRDGARHPVRPTTREAIALGDTMAFVPACEELRAMLALFGRPKDRARLRQL